VKPKDELPRLRNADGRSCVHWRTTRACWRIARLVAQVFFNVGTVDLNAQVNGVDVMQECVTTSSRTTSCKATRRTSCNRQQHHCAGQGPGGSDGERHRRQRASDHRHRRPHHVARGRASSRAVIADYDKVQCYANIKTVQKLLVRPSSYYTDINVKLKDMLQAPAMARELSARFDVDALDIQTANAQFETGSDVRNIISYAVGVVLLIVAGFGIYNILNMMIYEKLDAIAILKATGFSGSRCA
jgi:lipoprotein-releasing system permease protein